MYCTACFGKLDDIVGFKCLSIFIQVGKKLQFPSFQIEEKEKAD